MVSRSAPAAWPHPVPRANDVMEQGNQPARRPDRTVGPGPAEDPPEQAAVLRQTSTMDSSGNLLGVAEHGGSEHPEPGFGVGPVRSGTAGPAATATATAALSAASLSPTDPAALDQLAGRLYERLRDRLGRELRHDRERAGLATGLY